MAAVASRCAQGRTAATLGVLIAVALVATVAWVLPRPAGAAGPTSCSPEFQIDETLPSGARWRMCWEFRAREGVVLRNVSYTPPGGTAVKVLGAMYLAQIHVPYDDNAVRLHLVSDSGLGNAVVDLDPADCPGPRNRLHSLGGKEVLCQRVAPIGYAYKSYGEQRQASSLRLFSVSGFGPENFVVAWNFDEDGTIRPEVGATGKLERYGGGQATGWNVGRGEFAIAHVHNYHWRLDFDLGGPANDQVQELAASMSGDRQSFSTTRVPFTTEAARRVLPGSFRSWRVRDTVLTNADGRSISYELVPNTDSVFRGPSYEPFTQSQMYVTRRNSCEVFASHNPTLGGRCGSSVAAFANGGTLRGNADPVVWYNTSSRHLPRDEEERHTPIQWSGFSMIPRDLTNTYPIP